MKNEILIHKNYNLTKIYQKYFIALLPLIIYGFYKNGLLLYLDNSISFINMFKPLLFPILGAFSGLIVNLVLKKEFKFNPLILYGLIVGMIMPINTNIIIFGIAMIGLMFLANFLETKFSFNIVCFIKLLLVILLMILSSYEYGNVTEIAQNYAFSFIDILFGRGIGGVCSSSIVWIVAGFIYLIMDYYYKKEIPIYAIISYVIITLLSYLFIKDINIIISNVVSSSVLFAFIFIAPIANFSSYTKNGKLLFGILIGVITAVLTIFIGSFESAIIAILLASILKDFIDNIIRQKITK